MPAPLNRSGYTLVEAVVALLLFTVGGLAQTSTSAMVARELNANVLRERATRIAGSRLEILTAACGRVSSGQETAQLVESAWTVSIMNTSRIGLVESVSYVTWQG